MEQWEALIRSYPVSPTQGDLRKAVKSAVVVLKEDLAPFEIEWILKRLLTEPVNLLSSLSEHATDNNWTSVIGTALDLLSNIFTNHAEHVGRYEEDIVMTCLENYSAINRRRALGVLSGGCAGARCAQWGAVLGAAARGLGGDDAVVVRAARARLVGAICEHHPDVLTPGQEITLWRTFLSVLESSKVTDSLVNGVLHGICGLLKHFGMDLPVVEINGIFYEKFSKQYVQIGSCEEVCFKILSNYSHLFPEKLSLDTSIRAFLWSLLQNGSKAGDTLVAVYKVSVNDRNVQNIVTTEIYPRVYSKNPQERSVSCRILSKILKKYAETTRDIFTEFGKNASKTCTNLDYSLSMKVDTLTENSEYDHDLMNLLEEAVWCIEANVPGCDSLLRSMILLHSAIPKYRKKKILIHTLLNAEPALRTAAITFLMSESRRSIDTYISIWREIFDTADTDSIVEKNRQYVVEDFVKYLVKVVEVSLNEVPDEKTTEKLSELLKLASYLFPMEHFSCHLPKVTSILDSVLDLQPISEGQVLFVGALMYTINDHSEIYYCGQKLKDFMDKANKCENQAIRCAACIAALQIPIEENDILYGALMVILSRNDVDNETLTKVISKLEEVVSIDNHPCPDFEKIKDDLISAVEKLKSTKVFTGKSGRILEREIVLFLGKYGYRFDRKSDTDDSSVILKKPLTLDIPNLSDGTTLKLNISRVYELAIINEDPDVLNALLSIISAYLSNKTDPLLQRALTAVIVKLSKCHSRMEGGSVDSLLSAVTLCDKEACIGEMFECISKEESPGPRKVLSSLLSHLLTLDPHSAATETSMRQLFDNTIALLRRPNVRDSVLECTECLIECIKQNNELFKELTPELLRVVFETEHIDVTRITFGITIDALIDKILIFDQKSLSEILSYVEKILNSNIATNNVKSVVRLLKEIYKILDKDISEEIVEESRVVIPYLVAAKEIFEFDLEKCRSAISCYQGYMKNNMEYCSWEQLSDFIEYYGEILLELRYQETLEIIASKIQELNANDVKYQYRYIKNCVDKIKQINGQTPQILIKQLEGVAHKIDITELTRNLKIDDLTTAHETEINALLKILSLLNRDNSKLVDSTQWMDIVIKFHTDEAAILKNKMAAMTDVTSVALHCSELTEIVEICQKNMTFVKYFMGPFSPYLMRIFERLDSKTVATLFNDILNYYAREKCTQNDLSIIIQCFYQIWPRLESTQTFEELHTILLNMSKVNELSICQDCQAVKWWMREMTVSEGDRKIQLLQVLPLFLQAGSEEYREMFNAPLNTLSEVLPLRAAWSHPAAMLAAVAALAASAHRTLATQTLLRLADDNVPLWLEATLEQCMYSLALKQDGKLLEMILDICNEDELSVCLFERAMGPLIRYSSQEICQDFFAKIMPKTLATLRRPSRPSASVTYAIFLVRCARAFTLVRWCFEKMSLQVLESPTSSLYSNIELNRSRNLAQEVCKLCVTLRNDVTSCGDEQMMKCFRYVQTSNYNCLAAVLLKTKPQAKFFQHLLKAETWPKLVDGDKNYVVYIEGLGRDKVKRHYVTSDTLSSDILSHTVTTAPAFTRRTLSDNPFMYDFIEEYDVQTETKAILLSDNELNSHPCSTTLCTVIKHLVSIQSVSKSDLVSTSETVSMQPDWLKLILDGLKSECGNVRWFLAQAIINCKEDLKGYTSALTPALLAVVAESPYKHEDKSLLNGLHINILNTINYWNCENSIKNDAAVNDVTKLLINTCVHHKQRNSVMKAVMQCLGTFVQIYGKYIKIDWSFVEEVLKDQTNEIVCFNILETMTVKNLYIQELLPSLITKLQTEINKQTHIAKLLGLALSNCQEAAVKMTVLSKLYRHLDRLRASNSLDYVKVLFYVQNGCKDVCNEINFRHITDLTPKMVREQRTKCLRIIANYLSRCSEATEYITAMFETIDICDSIISDETHEAMKVAECGLALMSKGLKKRVVHLVCTYCDSSAVETRKAAFGVVLKAAEEFLTDTAEMPTKRQKLDTTSKILQILNEEDIYKITVLAKIGFGLNDRKGEIRNMVFDRISNLLESKDMGVRFLESVLICIYLPSTIASKTSSTDAPGCLTAVLKLFLHGYTSLEGFGRLRLRDEPMNFRTNQSQSGPSKLLTMTRTFQGTFRTNLTLGSSRRKTIKKPDESPSLDVQKPIIDLTNLLLDFAQTNTEASTSLFLEIIKQFQSNSFINGCLAKQFCGVLAKNASMNELIPCIMQACRLCVDECSRVPGFQSVLVKLLNTTKRTEGYELTKLLYEDVVLRTDESTFLLGTWVAQEYDIVMEETKKFDMQEMLLCFDKLSNWDDLTMQKRRQIKSTGLPVLWTDQQTFRQALDAASDLPDWLSKMRLSLQQADFSSAEQYMELKNLDTWPRNPFVISCLTEIEHWQIPCESYKKLPCGIKRGDCLAQWAARLMYRLCKASDMESEGLENCSSQARSQLLEWCGAARSRGLRGLVPPCAACAIPHLSSSEIRPWLYEQCLMLRSQGLETNDQGLLEKALNKLETIAPNFKCEIKDLICEFELKWQLHRDMNSHSIHMVNEYTMQMFESGTPTLGKNQKCVISTLEMFAVYLNEEWESAAGNKNDIISSMTSCLSNLHMYTFGESDMMLCSLLNMLGHYDGTLPLKLAEEILETLSYGNHDELTLEQIGLIKSKFPTTLQPKLLTLVDSYLNIQKWKKCLELVCDVNYTLMQYCEALLHAVNQKDEAKWILTFSNMKSWLYENEFAGVEYHLLTKYKGDLYGIETFEPTDDFKTNSKSILGKIHQELRKLPPKTTMNMADICVPLSRPMSEGDGKSLAEILMLKNACVVRLERHVQVFTNSLRRPCIVVATLSSGHTKRFLIKRGEPLRADAAAARCVAALNHTSPYKCRQYMVVPLSQDCGIVEFLEDHVTVRSMLGDHDLNDISTSVRRAPDTELIVASRAASLAQFNEMCAKVPAHALRSSMENGTSCVKDFIRKKTNFQDSLASMAVYHWLLGLGDRHLENLMVSTQNGGVCGVDLAAILAFGANGPELPPARLTRMLTAVCDIQVLESRMQAVWQSLRDAYKLIWPVLKFSARWLPGYNTEEFDTKMAYIQDLLQGRALSHDITKRMLIESNIKYKENYCALLDEVFSDYPKKEIYEVDEQISSVLLQSTDTRILSVTRRGWEPWL